MMLLFQCYNRLSKLYTQKATSLDSLNTAKSTLDNAKAEMEAIEANIKQAEIEVNTAETNVGYTKITAPMDGTVISVPVSEGQTVNANQTTANNCDHCRLKQNEN